MGTVLPVKHLIAMFLREMRAWLFIYNKKVVELVEKMLKR